MKFHQRINYAITEVSETAHGALYIKGKNQHGDTMGIVLLPEEQADFEKAYILGKSWSMIVGGACFVLFPKAH